MSTGRAKTFFFFFLLHFLFFFNVDSCSSPPSQHHKLNRRCHQRHQLCEGGGSNCPTSHLIPLTLSCQEFLFHPDDRRWPATLMGRNPRRDLPVGSETGAAGDKTANHPKSLRQHLEPLPLCDLSGGQGTLGAAESSRDGLGGVSMSLGLKRGDTGTRANARKL